MSDNRFAKATVMVVDDEPTVGSLFKTGLELDGYKVVVAYDGPSALVEFSKSPPDVMLVDIMMPGMDGLELTRRIRQISDVPILIVTARGSFGGLVAEALRAGADDYSVKPVMMLELVARIEAVLRRSARQHSVIKRYEDSRLLADFERFEAFIDGHKVELSPTEFALLKPMLEQPDVFLTNAILIRSAWPGRETVQDVKTLRWHMRNLRLKLKAGKESSLIINLRGIGYKYVRPKGD
ncbi:MAG: response regulator transcription factor [Chloroflexi bacterium]|nr:response regulator transcription factor [Chloroflexota bacterium]